MAPPTIAPASARYRFPGLRSPLPGSLRDRADRGAGARRMRRRGHHAPLRRHTGGAWVEARPLRRPARTQRPDPAVPGSARHRVAYTRWCSAVFGGPRGGAGAGRGRHAAGQAGGRARPRADWFPICTHRPPDDRLVAPSGVAPPLPYEPLICAGRHSSRPALRRIVRDVNMPCIKRLKCGAQLGIARPSGPYPAQVRQGTPRPPRRSLDRRPDRRMPCSSARFRAGTQCVLAAAAPDPIGNADVTAGAAKSCRPASLGRRSPFRGTGARLKYRARPAAPVTPSGLRPRAR
jgi:hypothetical protein